MCDFLVLMKPEDKIYKAFYETREQKLYFNRLKELTGLSDSSLSNTLKKMEQHALITKTKTRSNTFYGLKNVHIIALKYSYLDIERFNRLNRDIRLPLDDLLKISPKEIEFILLFGSASRKKETKNSDIDLLIVMHKFSDEKLQKSYKKMMMSTFESLKTEIDAISNHSLSLVFTDKEEFAKSKDHLITQARTTGFPIVHQQNFYEVMLDEN